MPEEDPWTHVEVLRLGHRPERDKRITTHVALVARAFGASSIHIDRSDPALERTVNDVTRRFGGNFNISTGTTRKKVMGKWDGTIVHLTMYGTPLEEVIPELPMEERTLVIVGAEKVPADVYDLAHFNVSVSNQPHSEVSALAIFLDRFFHGRELNKELAGGVLKISPSKKTKKVIGPKGSDPSEPLDDVFKKKWSQVPSTEECMEILSGIGLSRTVQVHVQEVHRLGMEMVNKAIEKGKNIEKVIDIPLLEAGLLLHDIGRARTHSIRHITIGVELSRRLGLDERITSIIYNHPGAGITASEATALGLPAEDHIPNTIEEKLVCHSDNLVGESRRRPLSVPLEKLRSKGAEGAADRMISLHKELEELLGLDIDALV